MPDDNQLSEQEKKRRRRLRMLALLLFNPFNKLQRQIDSTASDVSDHFDDVGDSLDDGEPPEKAVESAQSTTGSFGKLIAAAMMFGFMDGARLTGRDSSLMESSFKRAAAQRAGEVSDMMNDTTVKMLNQTGTKEGHVLSDARAQAAAAYEATKGYYDGVQRAFAGTDEFLKEWITTGDDPCDDCLDNEDEGLIPMDEVFQSGDWAPLAHLNCLCVLGIRRISGI